MTRSDPKEVARADKLARKAAKKAERARQREEKAREKAKRQQERAREKAARRMERMEARQKRRAQRQLAWLKIKRRIAYVWRLRGDVSPVVSITASVLFLAIVLGIWTWLTWGAASEDRILSSAVLPAPGELIGSFKSLWFERALARNVVVSYWRVAQGLGLAILVGVPLGIACGAWAPVKSFFAPLSLFGRNVPVVALVPLTLTWFGTDELQKIIFLFIATVMFIVFDSARAIEDVPDKYTNTAYTLGASRFQILRKVLIPLAAPNIFGSIRLLFGLAFGYIVLTESFNMDKGLGAMIWISRRRSLHEHVYLILIVMTSLAFVIDRILLSMQRWLFPYRESK